MTIPNSFLAVLFLVSPSVFGQTAPNNPIKCAQHIEEARMHQQNPAARQQDSIDQIVFEQAYQDYLQTYDPFARAAYTIPVVVHVVHLNGPENISDEQIFDAIEKLNEDFSMTNPDLGNTVSAFSGITGNADIQFRLATKDPNGNCHSGITRTVSNTTYDTGMNWSPRRHPIVDAIAAEHGVWPQGEYMSVIVCIDPNGAAGYTYRPSNNFNPNQMYGAIFMRHDYMGVIGTASNTSRHTLAHEAGHWLRLSHTWGGTNSPALQSNCSSGGDFVSDTPVTIGWRVCNLQGTSCGSLDNVQNIMEYSFCSTMFTQGQAARMQTALNSSTAGRDNLITNANLLATGVLSPSNDICEAVFISNTQTICQGQTVTFQDVSVHNVVNRDWTFQGGSPATSSDSVVTVVYNNIGDYEVTLEVSNSSNTETTTITNFIKVLPSPGRSFPYTQGFEGFNANNGFPDNEKFFIRNPGGDFSWQIATNAASTGNQSVFIQNLQANTDDRDELISEPIDLTSVDSGAVITFSYDYAYREKNENNIEFLRVYISSDCGQTWSLREIINLSLDSPQASSSNFVPNSSDWKTESFTFINQTSTPSFRYKFEFDSDNGNNFYLDNINIVSPQFLSTQSVASELSEVSVFPNPTNGLASIKLAGYENTKLTVALYNIVGKKIADIFTGTISQSVFQTEVDLSSFGAGLYFVKVTGDNSVNETIKLIKQ